jgi:hypothetical protein
MSKPTFRRLILSLASSFVISSISFSQMSEIDFLRGGTTDAVKIIQAYFAPYANAFGAGLNGGWYNTAKPHEFGGFDITATLSIGIVPTSAGTYNVSDLGLETLDGTGIASTVSGPETSGPTLSRTESVGGYDVTIASFDLPQGTGWRVIPAPMAQVGIGMPMGTELKIRFLPKINIKDGGISMWGLGLMHSIMQYFPGNEMIPFDVSVFGGYTRLSTDIPLDLQPDTPQGSYVTYPVATSFNDQKLTGKVEAWNISVVGSVKIPVITFFGSLGYAKTVTDIRLKGNYPLPVPDLAVSTTEGVYEDAGVVSDFPAINIKNFSGLRANIGFRLKLSLFTFHADYTRSQYNVFTTGIGLSFR